MATPKTDDTRLVPHRCPVCTGTEYYGRLARPGTRETCPNHVTVTTDPDTGDKVQTVELVYLVEVAGLPADRNRFGMTGEDINDGIVSHRGYRG